MAQHARSVDVAEEFAGAELGDERRSDRLARIASALDKRAFTEDPVTRLFVMPDFQTYMGIDKFDDPIRYLNEAIGKYWANRPFELGLVVGTASARKA